MDDSRTEAEAHAEAIQDDCVGAAGAGCAEATPAEKAATTIVLIRQQRLVAADAERIYREVMARMSTTPFSQRAALWSELLGADSEYMRALHCLADQAEITLRQLNLLYPDKG